MLHMSALVNHMKKAPTEVPPNRNGVAGKPTMDSPAACTRQPHSRNSAESVPRSSTVLRSKPLKN